MARMGQDSYRFSSTLISTRLISYNRIRGMAKRV